MKYFSYITVLSLLLLEASCSSDLHENIGEESKFAEVVLGAEINEGPQTRLVASDRGDGSYSVKWETTDVINVYPLGVEKPTEFTYLAPNSDSRYQNWASFKGTIDVTREKYFVMYPAQSNSYLDANGKIHATIPVTQVGRKGSFDKDAALQFGALTINDHQEHRSVSLLNACAFFEVEIGENVSKVTVKSFPYNIVDGMPVKKDGVSSWKCSGTVTVPTVSSGAAVFNFEDNEGSSEYVELIPEEGKTCFDPGYYLIAFAPSTHFPGIQAYADRTDSQQQEKHDTAERNLAAGSVYSLGKFGYFIPKTPEE